VATSVPCASRPSSAQRPAISAITWSPSAISPRSSMIITRSASPSRLMPRSAPDSSTAAAARWGRVEPQPSLMLNPFGSTPIGTTSAPSSHSTSGAVR
jgi:hypothetical protein